MVATHWYPQGYAAIIAGEVDFPNEAGIKLALMGTGFTFDDTHAGWAAVAASEYGGATGYTAGGEALTTKAVVETDSSALTARADTTAYVRGDVVRTAVDSDRVFVCVTPGTSAAAEPGAMATLGTGLNITDGTVVWLNVGSALTILDSDLVSWTGLDGATATVGAILYNDDGVNEPLLGFVDFESSDTPTALTVTPPPEGWLWLAGGGAL